MPITEWLILAGVLLGAGLLAGIAAGLFGIGGGTIIVPALFFVFESLGWGGKANLHVAIGTSLAIIIVTSWRSLQAHRGHKAVDEAVLRSWSPWVALGAALGAALAGASSDRSLAIVYAIAASIVACTFIFGSDQWRLRDDLPTGWARSALGTLIGGLSAMMGVGGGAMGSMLLTLCGRSIHQAIATASGFGLAIGIPATIGFMVFGWSIPERPPGSIGYIHLPGLLIMGTLTTLAAPYGAKLAHQWDKRTLRRAFGFFLLATAGLILVKNMSGVLGG